MALTSEELEEMPKAIQSAFSDLELKIIEDLVGRIKKNNEITGTGEWDISQLIRMGESKKVIKNYVAKTLKLTYSEIENIFGDIFETGYNRDNALYMAVGADFIAYRDNKPLQQYIGAVKEQTKGTYKNITNTMGFVRQRQGTKTWVPLTKYYKDTLSRAVFEITSGAFSYNQVIKRTINEMTNSGLRTIDYASGRTSRIEVAAMRAIRTAITQVTAKVTEQNMEKLHTDYVEVSWHATARPTHQVWQGRVFKWNRNKKVIEDAKVKAGVKNVAKVDQSGTIKLSNREVREKYIEAVSNIKNSIDSSLPMEEKAKIAFEARNRIRTQARDMMADKETRKLLDSERPNKTFEELIQSKMDRKGMTREEAIQDIYKTATKTNDKVNKELGLGGD